jgi:hypothetical protein
VSKKPAEVACGLRQRLRQVWVARRVKPGRVIFRDRQRHGYQTTCEEEALSLAL